MNEFGSFMALENKDAVIASLKGDFEDVQKGVQKTMSAGGLMLKNGLQEDLVTSSEVSAPGSVPFSKSEILEDSIKYRILPVMLGEPITLKIYILKKLFAWFGFYGQMLEFGTSKMAARPWFFPGILQRLPSMGPAIKERIDEIIKRKNELAAGKRFRQDNREDYIAPDNEIEIGI